MKKLYLLVLSIVFYNIAFSAPIITAIANGNWNTNSTWNLNRLPKVGDTIVIPFNKTVTINDDQDFNGFVYIKILGRLKLQNNNSTLSVNSPSVIVVYTSGEISGNSASQKIRYNNSIIFKGNEVPVIGPQLASAITGGFDPFSVLPVKFIGFTVTSRDADVLIQWSTSQEINASMYEVERSLDGSNWTTIAYIAAAGNSSNVNSYSFTDKTLSANIAYYRIKEVDFDGQTSLTSVRSIKTDSNSSASEIKIASVQNKVLLQFPQQVKGNITVRFISISGQVLDKQVINNPVGQVVLNSKFTGNYIISVSNGQNINTAKQVIL